MANLEFCDTHNMVAYLNKSEGSEGFHQIVDFLNHSYIRYALIENPTIYVSLIQQFWQTATASTLDSGEIQITATIDGKVKIITEASIRRHLKLEDSDAIPDDYLLKFYACKDAKSLWEAIKNRFGGNKESKKMFQKIISQLEIHGKVISLEDVNLKLLRSLPSAWNNIALIMRNKSDLDTLSMDDLYNNLKIDADDLEEMDLKWQVSMLTMRVKRFIKKIGRKLDLNDKETVGFDKTKVECYMLGILRNRDAPRRNALVDTSTTNALVVQDGIGGYDWSFQAEEGLTNFALMAYKSQGSSSLDSELEEALKEKDDLKLKLENFEESSQNLTKLINSQISAKDKIGLGYDGQMNESEVVHSVFNNRESDADDNPVNNRFKTGEGFHAVPPPYTGNYIPPRPDLSFVGLDEYVFKSAVRKTSTSVPETETKWDTDNDNDSVFRPKSDQTKPKFTKINFVKFGENVKSVNKKNTHRQVEYPRKSQSPKEKPVLNNKGMVTGQREIRPIWNNAQRVNHQNKLTHSHPKKNFIPTAVATKSGQVPFNAAKQSSSRAAASISTARHVNTAAPKPKVNDALPTPYSYFQAYSPLKKPINKRTVVTDINFNKKINTAKVNNVTTAGPKATISAAEGNKENAVKSSSCWIWRPTRNVIDHISKDSRSYMHKRFDYVNLQGRLKLAMAWVPKRN
ncbi:hypothetical protein Tco_0478541 [Tanacetum coccineum]